MQGQNIGGYEGPRTLKENEWEVAAELSRSIFFPQKSSWSEGFRTWPMALNREYAESTFAMFHEGKPVSMTSRLERDFIIFGHRLRMGFIGGVCTHPEHRGKGLASTILSACMNRFHTNNVDFVYISGSRQLYYAAGANHIGSFTRFKLDATALSAANHLRVSLRTATQEDAELLSKLYQTEPIRFIRPRSDYQLTIEHGHCSGKACEFQIIEIDGTPIGYMLVTKPTEREGRLSQQVLECCGERHAVVSALSLLASNTPPNCDLYVEVNLGDPLCQMLSSLDVVGEPIRTRGTVKALDFCRTITKMLPYFESRMPPESVRSMEFITAGQRYVAHSSEGILEIDGETNMLWALLGAPPQQTIQNLRATSQMQTLVSRCLPLPLPSLHLNMI